MSSFLRPNLFIVGGPRCGTTFLFRHLGEHAHVFASQMKEPHFFSSDLLEPDASARSEDDYLQLFAGGDSASWRCEASPFYLYSEIAPGAIARFSPGTRIVASLRNPLDQLRSLHNHHRYMGIEAYRTVEETLAAEDAAREASQPLDNPRGFPPYRTILRVVEPLKRYFDAFGRDRVHVVVFDDLVADPVATYEGVLRFLDVSIEAPSSTEPLHVSNRARSSRLNRALRSNPLPVKVLRPLLPRTTRQWLWVHMRAVNTTRSAPPPMSPELSRRLHGELAPEIAALSDLLGRDLSRLWGY